MRVLVTGAGGSIGRALGRGLPDLGHELRGLDLVGSEHDLALGWITGDCLDPDVVNRAVDGVDAVVHLAGNPLEASLPECLESHVLTTARLLEAMLAHGVQRMVYASSNHAVGRTPHVGGRLTIDVPPRPDSFYGVSKVAAEALLSLYADRHHFTATALRIGSFQERPRTTRHLSTWLSPADAVRLVDAALRRTAPGLRTVYGVSANSRGWWDLEPGRAIGYHPRDDAESFAASVTARPDDVADDAHVGGPDASPDHIRPAF
ncbi:NAD(P)-dependent oxidoreductase [Aeromicrobium sp.]|uniref:NAD-dependent epimerase/dehydratase family protein n=1 Tax=Aeromicrobium sp. TaxID=1871063 RepID=UPI0019A30321|nr:NAD(P)-dependent oxidoreductase [Aeromicrobium sp.]MBC7630807.1 NAD(P)-dependent oxidoreductase [Aeromicrobium sp.]